ncbi:chromosome partitioning protein ParA [Vibrio azureus]|uniref:Chromosome segregation ATPase n=1 Tax=Vibrio azureus NBRC 104587 TaxID=1219077 RepID=U3A7I7_9VIBR|nr:hypothetical protein [Vibrio azureus]AUI85662.1 chromosome partitioning protein ParA [Vibrio azureus]GAD75906.1 hypothetical protein VAZ01S_032_00500 [Vibrio azureus NBRC 104587]
MSSINGLPPGLIPGAHRTQKTQKKQQTKKTESKSSVGQPSKVANAVAHSIKHIDESHLHRAQVHYDLPEGHARKAMEQYMDIMNRSRKEELAQLMGVDIYV